jgi:hypothetical protein
MTPTPTDYVTPTLWTLAGLFGALALSPVGFLIGVGMVAAIVGVAWLMS